MTTEARELYCYCVGSNSELFDEEAIHYGELWVRGLVRGRAQQYVYEHCSKGDRIEDIWTEKDIADVAERIMAERKGVTYAPY